MIKSSTSKLSNSLDMSTRFGMVPLSMTYGTCAGAVGKSYSIVTFGNKFSSSIGDFTWLLNIGASGISMSILGVATTGIFSGRSMSPMSMTGGVRGVASSFGTSKPFRGSYAAGGGRFNAAGFSTSATFTADMSASTPLKRSVCLSIVASKYCSLSRTSSMTISTIGTLTVILYSPFGVTHVNVECVHMTLATA